MTSVDMPDTESERSNVKAITDAIVDGFAEMYQLDRQIDALIERHIRPLREKKSEVKRILREGYNMPAKLVSARYTGYVIERTAEDAGDSATQDTIRMLYEALPVRGVVDLIQATGFAEQVDIKATPKNMKAAREAGRKRQEAGGHMNDCPFPNRKGDSRKLQKAWLDAFVEAKTEQEQKQAKAAAKSAKAQNGAEAA